MRRGSKAGKAAALAQPGDAQPDRAGPRLPLAKAVALDRPLGARLAIVGASEDDWRSEERLYEISTIRSTSAVSSMLTAGRL